MLASNSVRFNKNGKLVIMQVSDTQDLVYVRPAMVKMLDAAYDMVRPDLVLLTGDNILGNHLLDARFGSRKVASGKEATAQRMKASLAHVLRPLDKRGIPFAMIFGNHDDMNLVTKKEQFEMFREYKTCLPMNDRNDELDCDTYEIPVLSSDGSKTVFDLWMFDSAWYDKEQDKCFQGFKKSAVDWFIRRTAEQKAENGGKAVPSLLFSHIPFVQQAELCVPCGKNDSGAFKRRDGSYIRLDPEKAEGILGEPPSVCDDNGLFEAVKDNGSVLGLVSGHDHANCFEGVHDGVRFIQTSCASFRCYGNDARGVRVFVIDENRPEDFETFVLTYDKLCGTSFGSKIRYIWDADDKIPAKCLMIASWTLSAAAGLTAGLKLINKLK